MRGDAKCNGYSRNIFIKYNHIVINKPSLARMALS
jgi:hypothetical protein